MNPNAKITDEQFEAYLKQIRELAEGPFEEIQKEVEVTNTFPEEFYELARPWMARVLDPERFDLRRLAELTQSRTEVLNRLPEMVDFLAKLPEFDNELYTHKKMKTNPEIAKDALAWVLPVLEGVSEWTESALHDTIMAAIAESGRKNGQVLWPLRIAISGRAATPGGAVEIMYLLGREETLARVRHSLSRL